MSNNHTKTTPAVFWVVGIIFLLWNILGCGMYLMDKMTSDAKYAEMYGEAMAATRDIYPAWATGAYALAVWGGLLAAICLLLRKKISLPLFVLSLIAAIICFIPVFTESAFAEASEGTHWVMPVIVVLLGLVEIWWVRRKISDGTVA